MSPPTTESGPTTGQGRARRRTQKLDPHTLRACAATLERVADTGDAVKAFGQLYGQVPEDELVERVAAEVDGKPAGEPLTGLRLIAQRWRETASRIERRRQAAEERV